MNLNTHTILLIDPGLKAVGGGGVVDPKEDHKRTFTHFEGTNECLLGICTMYENVLKKQNKDLTGSFSYTLNEVYGFIDKMKDMNCFVYENSSKCYSRKDKNWIKQMIYWVLSEGVTVKEEKLVSISATTTPPVI